MIGYERASGLSRFTKQTYISYGINPDIFCESPDENAIASLVAEDFGIALVADTDALDHFQLHRLHLSDISLHHTVYMAYLKGHYQIPCKEFYFFYKERGDSCLRISFHIVVTLCTTYDWQHCVLHILQIFSQAVADTLSCPVPYRNIVSDSDCEVVSHQHPIVLELVSVASMLFQNSVQQAPPWSRLPQSHTQSLAAALPVQTSDPQPDGVRCSEYRKSVDIQPPASSPLHFHRKADAPSV